MEVKDNTLRNNGVSVPFKRSPNQSGTIVPKYLVIHYTAASTASSAINWMQDPKSNVSAHLHIGRDGEVVQLVEFTKRAFHAGKSEWKGLSDLNWHTIGIELQNTGTQEYTEVQLKSLVEVCRVLVKEYGIEDALGHSDIAPTRKVDPGKQFPMDLFKEQVFGKGSASVSEKETTTGLNLRKSASTSSEVVKVLPKGSKVSVLKSLGEWSEVFVCEHQLKGFVSSQYLK